MRTGKRIDSLYAWLAVDPADDVEGVISINLGGGAPEMPLIGADLARMESLRPYAEHCAKQSGRAISLVHFSDRAVKEVIKP